MIGSWSKVFFFLFNLNGNQNLDRGLDNEVQYTYFTYLSSAILSSVRTDENSVNAWTHNSRLREMNLSPKT